MVFPSFHFKKESTMRIFSTLRIFITIGALFLFAWTSNAQHKQFKGNHSLSWSECIEAYKQLDEESEIARLSQFGTTDAGKPLHLFVVNSDGVFYPELFDKNKVVILINNDIHAGEADGVDASLLFLQEILDPGNPLHVLLQQVIFCIIPMYNVDGALQRSSNSRVNQNGPEYYGFRANALNLDLNRDFIKCDSKNSESFSSLFTLLKPHLMVDTHVSNGADYPYTMTLISTQKDKLSGTCGEYLHQVLEPSIYEDMKGKGFEMCPYVNTMGRTPETGIIQFFESPRFATGYAALFNTIGFTTETHMLKPFEDRVEYTYQFLVSLAKFASLHYSEILDVRKTSDLAMLQQKNLAIKFELDTSRCEFIPFTGYTHEFTKSEVGMGERLFYNRNLIWHDTISYFCHYKEMSSAKIPDYYVIPQAWDEVIGRLILNRVEMDRLDRDTVLTVDGYYIDQFSTARQPYEGHFPHKQVTTKEFTNQIQFFAGDYLIPTNQAARRFLATVLEPTHEDSYFVWNFFDSILQQKEWFSDYVFEDIAAELLKSDIELRKKFEEQMRLDQSLASDHWNQLYWIYKNSPYYEKTAFRYPVFRLSGNFSQDE
jgi:hypothetical protein